MSFQYTIEDVKKCLNQQNMIPLTKFIKDEFGLTLAHAKATADDITIRMGLKGTNRFGELEWRIKKYTKSQLLSIMIQGGSLRNTQGDEITVSIPYSFTFTEVGVCEVRFSHDGPVYRFYWI